MREIKFRAWDIKAQQMYNSDYVETYTLGALRNERYHLLQYTGLKDKNGVEIYEGDIVQGLAPWGATDIFYEPFYAQFGGRDTDDFHPLNKYEMENNGEVIGNIYENPELLGEE